MFYYKEWYQDQTGLDPIASFCWNLFNDLPWISVRNRKQVTLGHRPYRFSGVTYPATPIPDFMLPVLNLVSIQSDVEFNTVHCNFYPNGNVGLGGHTDSEPEHISDTIVSLSFGASRNFVVSGNKVLLSHGDLLRFNRHSFHSVPAEPEVQRGRISLTFREFK